MTRYIPIISKQVEIINLEVFVPWQLRKITKGYFDKHRDSSGTRYGALNQP